MHTFSVPVPVYTLYAKGQVGSNARVGGSPTRVVFLFFSAAAPGGWRPSSGVVARPNPTSQNPYSEIRFIETESADCVGSDQRPHAAVHWLRVLHVRECRPDGVVPLGYGVHDILLCHRAVCPEEFADGLPGR